MPFASNDELPKTVKVLPSAAQTLFRRVFNTTAKGHTDYKDERLMKIAWAAVKNAGYVKQDDGQWVKESLQVLATVIDRSWTEATITYKAILPMYEANQMSLSLPLDIDRYQVTGGAVLISVSKDEYEYCFSFITTDEQLKQSGVKNGYTLPITLILT